MHNIRPDPGLWKHQQEGFVWYRTSLGHKNLRGTRVGKLTQMTVSRDHATFWKRQRETILPEERRRMLPEDVAIGWNDRASIYKRRFYFITREQAGREMNFRIPYLYVILHIASFIHISLQHLPWFATIFSLVLSLSASKESIAGHICTPFLSQVL